MKSTYRRSFFESTPHHTQQPSPPMVLNYIWIAFILLAFIIAFIRLLFFGDFDVFPAMIQSTFATSRQGFEISLGLTGVLSLWLGIMKIGEKGGVVNYLARLLSPILTQIFPSIPKNHPVYGSIFMNIAANMLGLDNSATPLGLKAMKQLQALNPDKDRASDAMIMFLVLNTSGLTLIPVGIMTYRYQCGAAAPTDIFIPILIATFISTLVGIIVTCLYQRISLRNRTLLLTLLLSLLFLGALIGLLLQLPAATMQIVSSTSANLLLMSIIVLFILAALRQKVNVYDAFIEGAKEGFQTAISIIPYLIAILVAIGIFRSSGGMDFLVEGVRRFIHLLHLPSEWVGALPTALMKPLSGSGARGMMVDTMNTYGADSFVGRLSSIFQGSTDTTFYILAVYFGSVGIRRTRNAVTCGLIADLAGILAGIFVAYLFFG